jgi:hypothetical protein
MPLRVSSDGAALDFQAMPLWAHQVTLWIILRPPPWCKQQITRKACAQASRHIIPCLFVLLCLDIASLANKENLSSAFELAVATDHYGAAHSQHWQYTVPSSSSFRPSSPAPLERHARPSELSANHLASHQVKSYGVLVYQLFISRKPYDDVRFPDYPQQCTMLSRSPSERTSWVSQTWGFQDSVIPFTFFRNKHL